MVIYNKSLSEEHPFTVTYNLSVDGEANYFVGTTPVLVHNTGPYAIYEGVDAAGNVVYVGQTKQHLQAREAQHHADALAEPDKYAGKGGIKLRLARGPDGKPLTNLSQDEAFFWERRVYDRAPKGSLANRQIPYTDAKMQALHNTYCPK